jgi:hypothetical protein
MRSFCLVALASFAACTAPNPQFDPRTGEVPANADLGVPEQIDASEPKNQSSNDLAQPGCKDDSTCPTGTFCAPNGMCLPGCRQDPECGEHHICQDHKCVIGCQVCVDDGNPCTSDFCDNGVCKHEPLKDGSMCPSDGNPCTQDFCTQGMCTHPNRDDGTQCQNEKHACLNGSCENLNARCMPSINMPTMPWSYQNFQDPSQSVMALLNCGCKPGDNSLLPSGQEPVDCSTCLEQPKQVICFQ